MAGKIYRVKEAFSGTLPDGTPFVANVDETIREGHPILDHKSRAAYVEEADKATYEWPTVENVHDTARREAAGVEQATAAPGEKRRR